MDWLKPLRPLLAKRRHKKILACCRRNGHWLMKRGEGRENKMTPAGLPIPIGPVSLWIMGCICGYSEVTDVGTSPYRRSFAAGERLKEEQKSVPKAI